MKLIRLLPILLVIGLSCLTSCQKEDLPPADNERTLFMYLPWSTNLTSYFYQNIADMEEAIARRGLDRERVLVFLSTSATEAELFEITVNNGTCTRRTVKEYTRPAFTTEAGLTDILNDMKWAAPAKSYSLIVGCHGMGWLPVEPQQAWASTKFSYHWEYTHTPLTRFFGGADGGIPDRNHHPLPQSRAVRAADGIYPFRRLLHVLAGSGLRPASRDPSPHCLPHGNHGLRHALCPHRGIPVGRESRLRRHLSGFPSVLLQLHVSLRHHRRDRLFPAGRPGAPDEGPSFPPFAGQFADGFPPAHGRLLSRNFLRLRRLRPCPLRRRCGSAGPGGSPAGAGGSLQGTYGKVLYRLARPALYHPLFRHHHLCPQSQQQGENLPADFMVSGDTLIHFPPVP